MGSCHPTATGTVLHCIFIVMVCCSAAQGYLLSQAPPKKQEHGSFTAVAKKLAILSRHSPRAGRLSTLRCSDADKGSDEVSIGWQRQPNEEEETILPVGTMPCIPVPSSARLAMPGQFREVHMYDTSNLQVHKYATKHTGGYYVQVLQDEEALAERKFRLCEFGTLCKIVSFRQGIHRNKYAERSDSVRASVLAIGRVQVGDVHQVEPFVAAKVVAAPLEYLEDIEMDGPEIVSLESGFDACVRQLQELGEEALRGTRFEGLAALWTGADANDDSEAPVLERVGLQGVVERISSSVAADGRRTRPGTPNSVGETVPFLLPHPFQPGQRASLYALAVLALLPPAERAEMYAHGGGAAALADAAARVEEVRQELKDLSASRK